MDGVVTTFQHDDLDFSVFMGVASTPIEACYIEHSMYIIQDSTWTACTALTQISI